MNEEMMALKKKTDLGIIDFYQKERPSWIANGSLERYKARLIAKEYTQTYGVEYHETFAPVEKMNTIKILLSLATIKDCSIHQFDMKNVFLHGDLEEEVYKERGQKNKKYTQDLFQGTGMAGCKPIDTPMEAHHLLGEKQKKEELTGSRYLSENG
ncbi:Retrovirus-related Pol polyprotein from transposon TNT 1-94 [Vitis vinifera]|uniref:Retrovirus-related Pol polyprotein from transposon TNT 1-94 n=1 Tax=Vitis vinifera TaxID=29760 RepID=A0A438HUR8_VITVI|nr:Retrovirus-related Pol polyprotein from transposon TNT 1-94 [Vitis vinifera]